MSNGVANGGRIVVVGGGAVGLSIAFHLARLGHRDITLVERHQLGSGTTAKGVGGLRQQFSTEINIELSKRAIAYFSGFESRVGEPTAFRQHGFLFLVDEPHWETYKTNAAHQNDLGVAVRLLEPADIGNVFPGVRLDGLAGATFCPTDGSSVPADVVVVLARRSRALGVDIREETRVVDIETDRNGAVFAVVTPGDRIECEIVIIAAGPWSAQIGQMAGVALPIVPRRRQAFAIQAPVWLSPDLPFTIDLASGGYIQPRPVGAVIGGNDRQVPDGFGIEVDWNLVRPLTYALRHRFPAMGDITIERGWVGVRDMTPDDHAIVGPVQAVPGLWIAAGFSGHGFVHALPVGELLAQWILTGTPDLDLSPLRLERFADGSTIEETAVF